MAKESIFQDPLFLKALTIVGAQVPAFAGAVMSLAFVGKLSNRGRVVAVVVGLVTAVFLAPALIDILRHFWKEMPPTIGSAITFLVALSAMGALPKLLKFIETAAGNPTGLLIKIATPEPPAPPASGEGSA